MPSTFQSTSYADVPVHEHNRSITRISRVQSFNLTTIGDKVQVFRMPAKGFKVTNVGLISDSFDSNGTKTAAFDIVLTRNDAGTEYSLMVGSTVVRAGGVEDAWKNSPAALRAYFQAGALKGEGWTIEVRVSTAPATPQAANLQVYLQYTCDTEGGELKRKP